MNKTILSILLLLVLTVAACGNASRAIQTSSTQTTDLPIETKLVVGTLRLEGTQQAVTDEQANELLVMWQVYQELSSSDTAAQAEIDGLIEQIQETMTAEQIKTITAMNLTQQDVFALLQEQGAGVGSSQQNSSANTFSFSPGAVGGTDGSGLPDGGGAPPDAGMAGGIPPDGGMGGDMGGMGGAGSGSGADKSQDASASSSTGGSAGVPTALVGVLIQYLEGKAGS